MLGLAVAERWGDAPFASAVLLRTFTAPAGCYSAGLEKKGGTDVLPFERQLGC